MPLITVEKDFLNNLVKKTIKEAQIRALKSVIEVTKECKITKQEDLLDILDEAICLIEQSPD